MGYAAHQGDLASCNYVRFDEHIAEGASRKSSGSPTTSDPRRICCATARGAGACQEGASSPPGGSSSPAAPDSGSQRQPASHSFRVVHGRSGRAAPACREPVSAGGL